jgi:hypothetical protein
VKTKVWVTSDDAETFSVHSVRPSSTYSPGTEIAVDPRVLRRWLRAARDFEKFQDEINVAYGEVCAARASAANPHHDWVLAVGEPDDDGSRDYCARCGSDRSHASLPCPGVWPASEKPAPVKS